MYTDILNKNRTSKQFTGQDSLSLAAYNYVRKNKFETMVQPEQSNALDASTETLKIKYDLNNFSIDLSRVSNKPETVTALLESIFNYIEKHIPGWQKEAGLK